MKRHNDARVVAVISAFHPPEDLPERVQLLNKQVLHTIVVDDGSDPEGTSPVLQRLDAIGCTVIRLQTNLGIAAALNRGLSIAMEIWSPDFLLTLDQDSSLDAGYVDAALDTYERARLAGINVGLIGAQSHNGIALPLLSKKTDYPEAFDPMQSGALMPISTLEMVGKMNERLFIDFVDSEFNLRVRSEGLSTLIGLGCNMTHALGQAQPLMVLGRHVTVLGMKRHLNFHAPFRVYYMTRNGIYLWSRYATRFPGWLVRRSLFQLQSDVLRLLFGSNRKGQMYALARGAKDGFLGRLGKIDPSLEERISK